MKQANVTNKQKKQWKWIKIAFEFPNSVIFAQPSDYLSNFDRHEMADRRAGNPDRHKLPTKLRWSLTGRVPSADCRSSFERSALREEIRETRAQPQPMEPPRLASHTSHKTRRRVREVKRKARPGQLLFHITSSIYDVCFLILCSLSFYIPVYFDSSTFRSIIIKIKCIEIQSTRCLASVSPLFICFVFALQNYTTSSPGLLSDSPTISTNSSNFPTTSKESTSTKWHVKSSSTDMKKYTSPSS